MAGGATVHVDQLGKRFGARAALHGLNLSMRGSEFVSVVGKSGSGKSTLLRVLCGLEAPSEGSARIDTGTDAGDAVRVVFQEPRLLPWRSVLDNVRVGLHSESSRLRALEVLAQVGLADRASEFPGVLSGGEKQRVALARALFCEPKLMLFDEPFGALDALTRVTAQRLVERLWQERGFSALLVTHDVEEAVLLADRIVLLSPRPGRVVATLDVPPARPRHRADAAVVELRERALAALGAAS
jgi:sulfonate transport system ATP-binding protein